MATMIGTYPSPMYYPQGYNYPIFPSAYPSQPIQNNYYTPSTQPKTTVQYVDASSAATIRPRRQPRVYREVIVLPTPEPIYRQVRHRLPTPDRQVIQRTIIQKANGDVIVRQDQTKSKPRSQSRSEPKTQTQSTRSRQIHTD